MATKQETINFEEDINPSDQAQKELKIEPYDIMNGRAPVFKRGKKSERVICHFY